ncbi:cytochrome P450 [Lenzites betulinus]|nr:cytochrome P450 [Lenzites betulinus]
MAYSLTAAAVAAFLSVILWTRLFNRTKRGPLPPGPKGYPIIGNLLEMPTSHEYRTYAKWGERWGDIMSVTIFGENFLILNSTKRAVELLEKKSSIYSSRPFVAMGELVGWDRTLVLAPYGNKFREYRRLFFQLIGSKRHMERFLPLVEDKTRTLLARLYKDPVNRVKHLRWSAAAIMLMMTYGYEVQSENDPLVAIVSEANEQFAKCVMAGSFLVNILPVLAYIPGWVPGAGFKKIAVEWRKTLDRTIDWPFDFVKRRMTSEAYYLQAAGTDIPNFTSENLAGGVCPDREEFVKNVAMSLYAGGADTTMSTIDIFFLCMTLHPEVQNKAQAEIDAVVGTDRLPTAADREELPYVEAIYLEVLRWNNVTPSGAAHRSTEDDFHEGYFIPKGTHVIANLWQILHDPQTYPDPMSFNPDRFACTPDKEPQADPRSVVFGFGRRICPGMQLADASVWLAMAMSLAVFKIAKSVDADGKPIEPSAEFTSGAVVHPLPYECDIAPRSAQAKALLDAMVEQRSD